MEGQSIYVDTSPLLEMLPAHTDAITLFKSDKHALPNAHADDNKYYPQLMQLKRFMTFLPPGAVRSLLPKEVLPIISNYFRKISHPNVVAVLSCDYVLKFDFCRMRWRRLVEAEYTLFCAEDGPLLNIVRRQSVFDHTTSVVVKGERWTFMYTGYDLKDAVKKLEVNENCRWNGFSEVVTMANGGLVLISSGDEYVYKSMSVYFNGTHTQTCPDLIFKEDNVVALQIIEVSPTTLLFVVAHHQGGLHCFYYHINTNKMKYLPIIPILFTCATACVLPNKDILVVSTIVTRDGYSRTHRFSVKTNEWKEMMPLPFGINRAILTVLENENKTVMLVAMDGGILQTWFYDIEAGSWWNLIDVGLPISTNDI